MSLYTSCIVLLRKSRPIVPCVTTHNFNTWFNIIVTSTLLAFLFKDAIPFQSLNTSMRWHAISTMCVMMLLQLHVREKFVWLIIGLGHNLFELSMGMHMFFGDCVPSILACWFAFELIVSANSNTFEDTVDNIFFSRCFLIILHLP